ncbi:endoribonuclease Dcr-2 isoform X1 [Megalopta genalis]|uniref:endoribonuclease Dcr-2 isoform X1 n=2 Tax=Megalopta genalis TaxID=115081 RepID=UPI003FCFB0CC
MVTLISAVLYCTFVSMGTLLFLRHIMESNIMENCTNEFTPRTYQIDLYEIALQQNTIIYLPTGCGKTFIAVMLIRQLSSAIRRPYAEGGKHTVFLVNSVPLVTQQSNYIARTTGLTCGEYYGEKGVDYWSDKEWNTELENHQVLIMTSQIFLDALCHSFMFLNRVNLLILDECHSAVNDHPMRQIMQLFKACAVEEQPRVLGLTATLLNANVHLNKVESIIRNLEITLHAKIATVNSLSQVKNCYAQPNETFVKFKKFTLPDVGILIWETIQEMTEFLKSIKLKSSSKNLESSEIFRPKPLSEKLANILTGVMDQFLETGVYGAYECILLHMIQLESLKKHNEDVETSYVYEYLISEFTKFRKLLEEEMKDASVANRLKIFTSNKVQQLFAILLDFYESKLIEQKFCCIIFVDKRFTAKVLYHLLKNLSTHEEKFRFLQPDYVIGISLDPFKNSKENLCMSKWNKKVLCRFNNGTSNCLIATEVVDEGIDVPSCTLIIRFHLPMNIRAYIQSKGRARYNTSQFTLLIEQDDTNYLKRFKNFKEIDSHLQELLLGKTQGREGPTENEIEDTLYARDIEPYIVTNCDGHKSVLHGASAISLINMYCSKLNTSKFVRLTPVWRLIETEEIVNEDQCKSYQVSLKLPIVSPYKNTVVGDFQSTVYTAKRSAALKMCIELHKFGELNDNLLPREVDFIPENTNYLFPNWVEENKTELEIIGTKKKKRSHELQFPSALYGAYPLPSKPVYLHLLHARPTYPAPHYDNRYLVFYNLLCDKAGFGILSSKQMPLIPSFPIFMNVGELQVDVKVNYATMNLSATEISSIKVFHSLIFSRVVPIIKSFMIFDNYNRDNCFLIVPVNEKWEINWEAIQQHQQIQSVPPPAPFEFQPDNYHELSLVMPTYRAAREVYVVTQVCEDLTPNSCFPTDNFYSYVHYYKRKHGLTINNLTQPMLEAKMISKQINCIKPRTMQSESKYHKRMETNDVLKEHLVPELCKIIKFPALYWLKATMLPSVLHRISQLLIAEDLRRVIVNEAGFESVDDVSQWPPLVIKEEDIEDFHDSVTKISIDESIQNSSQPEPVLVASPEIDVLNTDMYNYPWTEDQEPPDLCRRIEDIRLIDIEHHYQFMLSGCDINYNEMRSKKVKFMNNSSVPIRELKVLSIENSESPNPVEIMHALTSKIGRDAFDLERLETLGDSYLKFVTSLFLYDTFPNCGEGTLTTVKSKIIGNRNLYYCGKKKSIPGRMKVDEFVPLSNFIAPAYSVFRQLQEVLLDAEVSPNVLYEIQVPEKEQFSGCISEFTKNAIETKVSNWESAETQTGMEHYLGMQTLPDKTVADCVEALIGVYLVNMGIKAAIKLLTWFEILPKQVINIDALLLNVHENQIISQGNIDYLMPWASDIEKRLGYKFKNRAFLLQAFTHSSYSPNTTIECYQRLEFLGDAVIDFLITSYIYEYCGNLNPGALTDLRSALVNNITFACLSVRYGLHTALLAYAPQLIVSVDRFVKFQEERNHVVNDELLWILLEEDECKMVESVDVPKVLGDLFESAIGAIYLDCKKNLKKVWEILYSLMHKEIDEFSNNIPKQPVRVLYETEGARPQFLSAVPIVGTSSVMVPLKVIIAGQFKRFHGFGINKKEAKRAAAKLALKYLLRTKT